MYAYRRQNVREYEDYNRLRVVRTEPVRKKSVVQKKVKVKKKINPIVKLFRLFVVLSTLSLFMYFVYPTCFNNLIKQVIFPNKINVSGDMAEGLAFKDKNSLNTVDIYTMANPTVNYLANDLFNNRLLLTPTIQKSHSEVTTMYQTSEMAGLKGQLQNLMKSYPMIKPTVYVWEYENGQYVNIDADKQYSAASIIKL